MDVSRLRSTLNKTKLQTDNNALYQLLFQFITQLESINTTQKPDQVKTIEIDTSTIAVNVTLVNEVTGLTIIKDKTGNAAANNITLVGTVDGVVNPVINTNFGIKRVHPLSTDFGAW